MSLQTKPENAVTGSLRRRTTTATSLLGPQKQQQLETETDALAVSSQTETERDNLTESQESFTKLVPPRDPAKRWSTFKVRCFWTVTLILSFFLIISAGHFYASILVLLISAGIYKEVIALKRNAQKENKLPLFFFQRWYWFTITIFSTLYGYILPLAKVMGVSKPGAALIWIVESHTMVAYLASFLGLAMFTLSLRKFSLRYQFGQLALLLMTCVLVVGQTAFQIKNIYAGLFWFFFSALLVITNDISAYLFGTWVGRTRLLRLSPNKTVEGFLCAGVFTVFFAIIVAFGLSFLTPLTCPQPVVTLVPFKWIWQLQCDPPPAPFQWQEVSMPHLLLQLMPFLPHEIWYKSIIFHAIVLALFASFAAPFGGFFASAFKRALKIKDFAGLIPGHGGVTDRFDCQVIMGMFVYLYLRTFVMSRAVPAALSMISRLTFPDKAILFAQLAQDLSADAPEDLRELQRAFCAPFDGSTAIA